MLSVLMLKSGSGNHVFWLGYEKVPWMNGMARKDMKRPNPMRRNPVRSQSSSKPTRSSASAPRAKHHVARHVCIACILQHGARNFWQAQRDS